MLGSSEVCATIAVKDMTAAAKFYEGTLGLSKSMETPGGTFYKSGNSGIFVYPSAAVAGSNQATYAAWMVSDVDSAVADLSTKGVSFEHYDNIPGMTWKGDVGTMQGTKTAWFKDPDGNILNIVNGMA